MTWITC